MSKKDLYQILEIDKNSTQNEIEKSYQELVIKWNPDKFRTSSKCEESSCGLEKADQGEKFCSPLCKSTYEEYEIKMKEINDAYEVLSDPKKRKEQDNKKIHEISNPEPNKPEKPSGSKTLIIVLVLLVGGVLFFCKSVLLKL